MDAIQSKTLRKLILPLPAPPERKLIYARYVAITEAIGAEQKGLEKQIKKKSGLMHDLLTGKVQVKVDDSETIRT